MNFAPIPLDDALGCVLAHSRRAGGLMLKKGTVLDQAAIAALRQAGFAEVVAARLDAGDLTENVAADRLAAMLVAPWLHCTPSNTGRVNLVADAKGLLVLDAAAIDRINEVDEALTLATLPNHAVVAPGDMVATIKVIPFAVSEAVQARVEAQVQGAVFRLHPFRPLRVGLVLSEIGRLKDSVVESSIAVTEARVTALGGALLPPRRCPHEAQAIAAALSQLHQEGAELLLVIGASATVDRRDIGPDAIVRAGGEITHFGMPVDPGNLICLGRIGQTHAIVLPGCARSPKLNGIDFVLARIFAGLKVGRSEVMRMGVGGLLKDTESRPLPRARATATRRVAAIVLAAGRSSRMGPRHKLLIEGADGRAMVARTVDHLLQAGLAPVSVVVGHRADEIKAALAGRDVRFVLAERYAEGLAESLKAGLAALPENAAAFLIALGDMPLVDAAALRRIVAAYDPDEGRLIVTPRHGGRIGNPILWDRGFAGEMMQLTGDIGARSLLRRHEDAVFALDMQDDAVLRDFDTPESLAALE